MEQLQQIVTQEVKHGGRMIQSNTGCLVLSLLIRQLTFALTAVAARYLQRVKYD